LSKIISLEGCLDKIFSFFDLLNFFKIVIKYQMPVDVQKIIKTLEERKNRNIKYLEKKAPQLLDLLKKPSKLSKCGIYIDPQSGLIDLIIEDQKLYQADPHKATLAHIDEFERSGFKFYIGPDVTTPEQFKDSMMDMRHWYEYLVLAKEKPNIDFVKKIIRKGDIFGTFLCLGIGLGHHLVELTKRYEIKQFIIVEQDSEIFKASLFTIDWSFLEKYMRDNRTFNVFIRDDPFEAAKEVVAYCQFILNPPIGFDMPVFSYFKNSFFEKFMTEFMKRFNQIFTGWGFFQDEYWSVEHTLENIKNQIPLFYGNSPVSSKANAFIIGAGPSLDYSLDFIKKNSDKAVIFSCGSSLSSLHRAGIKPDFHIDIERTVVTYDALVWIGDPEYVRTIPVIFNNPMYPLVSTLFDESYMYLKANDAGTVFFESHIPRLIFSNPTVVNGGLSFAVNSGFKEIYLFGTDMGYKDPKKHHANHNVALDKNTYFYAEELGKDLKLEGNFGGDVYTNMFLNWARTWIEDLIKTLTDVKIYNTSDGAKIKGAIPTRLENISLKKFEKDETVRTIKQNFSQDYLKNRDFITKRLEQLKIETKNYRNYSLSQLNSKIKNKSQLMDALHNIFVWIYLNQTNNGILNFLVRGGFLHYEHLALFLCYQKEIRGINFVPETVEAIRRYIEESTDMLFNLVDKYRQIFR